VDLVLSGELHAANEKFNSIAESKVVTAIEDEKLKIAQTLFSEDDDEDDDDDDGDKPKKGKIPPQFLKGKDKDDGDDDDSDSDDDDDDDDGKSKKGKVPPQFMKKEDHIIEDLARDIEAGFKKLSSKKAKAGKQDSFEGSAIKCGDFKVVPGKFHDASDTTPGADENIAFHVYVEDGKGKAVTGKINASQGSDAIDFETESGKFSSGDKKTAKEIEKWCKSTSEAVEPKNEGITGDDDANEKALAKNRAMAKKYGQVRQGIPADKKEEVKPEQSFDPGEASTNMPLPEYSFVAQVANHLSGNRDGYIKEDLARDIEAGFKKLSSKKAKAGKSDGFEGNAIKCGDYKITPVKYHDASDTTPGADENIDFHVYVEDGKGKAVTGKINASQGADAIDFETESGKFSSSDKKTAKEIEKWCNSN
jgi:RNA binding exosome subunit